MTDILPILLGGLALFLHSIGQLSSVMQQIFSERAKTAIRKYTNHIFLSILVGTAFTILLDSSSAVIILVIIFINAQTLTFRQAIGIIMGANIGTTFSSQIIALDIGKHSIWLLIVGLIIETLAKQPINKRRGAVLLYFGMLFFGLFLMETAVLPLKDNDTFREWIAAVENNYVHGALIGGLVTLILQSSSGTVGIAIVLGKQGILSMAGGVAIMLGAELGTCSDTLLATIKGNRQALKAGLFHLFFNLITITIGLLLFNIFIDLILFLSKNRPIGTQIAHAHVLFNLLGVILFLPFVNLAEKTLNRLLPDKKYPASITP